MKIIKILNMLLTIFIFTISINANNIIELKKDLDILIGNSYYIFDQKKDYTKIIIYKRFSVDLSENVVVYEYSPDFINFIQKNLSQKYSNKFSIEIATDIPPYKIDDAIRKKKLGTILLFSLVGVISLFLGFIIFRTTSKNKEIKNRT